jgi:hypothetical protein
MLQQALNRHAAVVIPPEIAFFTFLTQSVRQQQVHFRRIEHDLGINIPLPSIRVSEGPVGRALFEAIAHAYISRIGRLGVSHFGEKSPVNLRRYKSIRALFPDAKMVLIYRDGRDVALSLSNVQWMPPNLYLGFALWLHYARVARRAAPTLGRDLHAVRYEDLVREPERELTQICQFLGLDYRAEMSQSFGNIEGVPQWEWEWKWRATKPITDARIGRWRSELTLDQIATLEQWGGYTLTSLGYDLLTKNRPRLSPWFFVRVYARAFWWLATRPGFGDFSYAESMNQLCSGESVE